MGVLQDFERRLEGAVEGVFARIFRSGLQPVELAKGLQRYARDTQHVTHDGVVVPNVYRFTINPKDHERIRRLGLDLAAELAQVVTGTATERGWLLRGPAAVRVHVGEKIPVGRFELTGRVEPVASTPEQAAAPEPRPRPVRRAGTVPADHTAVLEPDPPPADPPKDAPLRIAGPRLRVVEGGPGGEVGLVGRTVVGRAPSCAVVMTETTVSREHAAFVPRQDAWWVMDLGSMNGTRVNGRTAAEHPLTHGDTITLGDAVLEYLER